MCGLFRPRLTEKQKNGVLCKTKAAVTLTLANRLNEFSTICQQNLKQQYFKKNQKKTPKNTTHPKPYIEKSFQAK